jgi:hypothetical protein
LMSSSGTGDVDSANESTEGPQGVQVHGRRGETSRSWPAYDSAARSVRVPTTKPPARARLGGILTSVHS